jgi:hypothetical protein
MLSLGIEHAQHRVELRLLVLGQDGKREMLAGFRIE